MSPRGVPNASPSKVDTPAPSPVKYSLSRTDISNGFSDVYWDLERKSWLRRSFVLEFREDGTVTWREGY